MGTVIDLGTEPLNSYCNATIQLGTLCCDGCIMIRQRVAYILSCEYK